MNPLPLPVTLLLIAWGNVLLATVPHLLSGPLRPIPLGHLAWLLSLGVLGLTLLPAGRKVARPPIRFVATGLLVGLAVGIVSGIHTPASIGVNLVIIGMVGLGQEAAVALVTITAVALGFHGGVIGNGTPAPPTPPWRTWAVADSLHFNPNAVLIPTDTSRGQLRRAAFYGDSLFWDSVADKQRLLTSGGGVGPLATVWAERRAYLVDPIALRPAEMGRGRVGRIAAKVEVEADSAGTGYPPLGLFAGVTYVWVDSLDPDAGVARAVLIAGDGSAFRTRTLRYERRPAWKPGTAPVWANFSRARWVYGQAGYALAFSCAMGATCHLEPEGETP